MISNDPLEMVDSLGLVNNFELLDYFELLDDFELVENGHSEPTSSALVRLRAEPRTPVQGKYQITYMREK